MTVEKLIPGHENRANPIRPDEKKWRSAGDSEMHMPLPPEGDPLRGRFCSSFFTPVHGAGYLVISICFLKRRQFWPVLAGLSEPSSIHPRRRAIRATTQIFGDSCNHLFTEELFRRGSTELAEGKERQEVGRKPARFGSENN
jgi:hypothetical protein